MLLLLLLLLLVVVLIPYHVEERESHAQPAAVVGRVRHVLIVEEQRPRDGLGAVATLGVRRHVRDGNHAAPDASRLGHQPVEDAEDGLCP